MRVLWISVIAILVDQVTKVIVVRNMYLHQSIPVLGDWLKFTYLENPGMAFGITFGPPSMISIFSILATFLIVVYLFKVRDGYLPYRASIGLVLGGAFGNIIDRVFYGSIYYDNPLFQGRVVDFIHVDAWRGVLPEWIPLFGGNHLTLFPIWNVADMAIVLGVVGILFFQKRFHELLAQEDSDTESDNTTPLSDESTATGDVLVAAAAGAEQSEVTATEVAESPVQNAETTATAPSDQLAADGSLPQSQLGGDHQTDEKL